MRKVDYMHQKQSGVVSLFVVIFAALLITVVTIGFVQLMIKDQQQATVADLSQSAYDSAQAGIEDAKRALVRFQSICDSGQDCSSTSAIYETVNSETCNTALESLTDIAAISDPNEVNVQTGGANSLDQAYTCVKISLDTVDYLGKLAANESKVIPLRSVNPFDTIQIQWFNSEDISSDDNYKINLQPGFSASWPLLNQNSWDDTRPALMRVQLTQFSDNGFKLSDFDNSAGSQSNSNTIFLYPSGNSGVSNGTIDTISIKDLDSRKTPTGEPEEVSCSGDISDGSYACTTKITLPEPIGGGDRNAYIRLSALYNNAHYRVTLLGSNANVFFKAVQPEIDSTGRANDLFRRVLTRVELADINFPYPDLTVDTTGNLCKDFQITDKTDDYRNNCTP